MKNHIEFPSSMAAMFISIIIILISSAAVAWWWFHNHFSKQIKKKLPPSPPRFPIIGNLHQLGSLPHRNLRSLSNQYGDLMLLHLGSTPVLIVSSAIAAKEILKTHDLIFANRPHSTMADKLLYGSQDISSLPYGNYWRQLRTICVTQLLSNGRVQSFRRVREQETTQFVQKIISACGGGGNSCLVNLSEKFLELTNDVICRVALGKKYSDENGEIGKKFEKMLMEFGELLGFFYIGDYIPWLGWVHRFSGLDAKADKLAKEFDDFLEDVVQQHRINNYNYYKNNNKKLVDDDDESVGPDFVDILLEIQGSNSIGFEVKKDMIKALILDMFAAGTDTTLTVMEWTMAELLKNPKVMQKLQTEIRKVAGGNGKQEMINEEDIEKMPYLKAVIKETLRLHPPVPLLVPRESSKDVNIMGYHISKGTRVIVNAWAIGRDPNSWGIHESEQFLPERFLNNNNGMIDVRGLNFELIPFGSGRRGCPGITFAIAVNELVLGKLLHKIDFVALLPDGMIKTDHEDFDMTESSGLTVHRKLPILAMATPHSCS